MTRQGCNPLVHRQPDCNPAIHMACKPMFRQGKSRHKPGGGVKFARDNPTREDGKTGRSFVRGASRKRVADAAECINALGARTFSMPVTDSRDASYRHRRETSRQLYPIRMSRRSAKAPWRRFWQEPRQKTRRSAARSPTGLWRNVGRSFCHCCRDSGSIVRWPDRWG